ncbi:MAG: 4Fe-4S binding protein [Chloroflexota bacterium]|nr:4Fe-4S binding protein [Chloroflexota bacterium]
MSTVAEDTRIVYDPTKCRVCYNCELICSLSYTKKFNPSESRIRISSVGFGKKKEMHVSEDCTECGLCVQFCPCDALSMSD